jgi:hypothetical protein
MREVLLLVACLVVRGGAQAVGARGGCWALNEAQFYATQERRVLQALAEFKVIGAPDKLSLPTGETRREGERKRDREKKRFCSQTAQASHTIGSVQFWHETAQGVVNATSFDGERLKFSLPSECALSNLCVESEPTEFDLVPSLSPLEWKGTVKSQYVRRAAGVPISLSRRHAHQLCANELAACQALNSCSGHGTCVAEDTCFCRAAWTGVDCSEPAPTAPPAPAQPPVDVALLPRPPLLAVPRAYDSDRRCQEPQRDADFDNVTRCTERRVSGDSEHSVVAPLYQAAGWPLDAQLFVPRAAFSRGVDSVDTYTLPPDAYFFADDGGAGIAAPITAAPTPAPAPSPPVPGADLFVVDPLAGVPLSDANMQLLSAILAVRITMSTAPIGVVINTAAPYSVCLRLLETNKPPPPTPPPTPPTTTTEAPPTTTGMPVPARPAADPAIEFAPRAEGAKPLDQNTCIAQLVCTMGPAPAPRPTTMAATAAPTGTPSSMQSCSNLSPQACALAANVGCELSISMVCVQKQRRRQAPMNATLSANATLPAATPAPATPQPQPADLAAPMEKGNIERTSCTWQCVDGTMLRGTAYAVHGMRLPYDSVCIKVKTVNTMFVVLRLEPPLAPVPEAGGLSGGAIAGIVVGILGALALAGALAYWWFVVRDGGDAGSGAGGALPTEMNFSGNSNQFGAATVATTPDFGVPGANSNQYGVMGAANEMIASSYDNTPVLQRMMSATSIPSRSTISDVQIGMYGSTSSLQSAPSSYGGTVAPAVSPFKPKFSGPTGPQHVPQRGPSGTFTSDDRYIAVPSDFKGGAKPAVIVATYGPASESRDSAYGDMQLKDGSQEDGRIYGFNGNK